MTGGGPNWAEIATAAATVITLGLFIFDRLPKSPALICRAIPTGLAPDMYQLTIQAVSGWEGMVTTITGRGVLLALPDYDQDEFNAKIAKPGDFVRTIRPDKPMFAWSEGMTKVHFFVSVASDTSHSSRSVIAEVRWTAPRRARSSSRVRVETKI
jgi:hypothetical protein